MTVDQWQTVLGNLPSPNGSNTERTIASRILCYLSGYSARAARRGDDVAELANAMTAYARMMFDAGVRP